MIKMKFHSNGIDQKLFIRMYHELMCPQDELRSSVVGGCEDWAFRG